MVRRWCAVCPDSSGFLPFAFCLLPFALMAAKTLRSRQKAKGKRQKAKGKDLGRRGQHLRRGPGAPLGGGARIDVHGVAGPVEVLAHGPAVEDGAARAERLPEPLVEA